MKEHRKVYSIIAKDWAPDGRSESWVVVTYFSEEEANEAVAVLDEDFDKLGRLLWGDLTSAHDLAGYRNLLEALIPVYVERGWDVHHGRAGAGLDFEVFPSLLIEEGEKP